MKKLFGLMIFVSLMFSIILVGVYADSPPVLPHAFYGTVLHGTSDVPSGVEITAEISGQQKASFTMTSDGAYGGGSDPDTQKLIVSSVSDDEGKAILFYVGGALATTTPSSVTWRPGGISEVDLLVASGTAINGNGICESGETHSTDSACEEENGGGGGSEEVTTPTGTAPIDETEEPEEEVIQPKQEIITDEDKVEDIIAGVDPRSIGMEEITPEDVEVTKIGELSKETTVTIGNIDDALNSVTDDNTIEIFEKIRDAITSGESGEVNIKTDLNVYEVKSKDTGAINKVSEIRIVVTAQENMKDVEIVEVIPKSVAASIAELAFPGIQPEVIQADPIVRWYIANLAEGSTAEVSYIVKKEIDKIESNTIVDNKAVREGPFCGNKVCESGENNANCPGDCLTEFKAISLGFLISIILMLLFIYIVISFVRRKSKAKKEKERKDL